MSSENIIFINKVDLKKEKKKAYMKEYDKNRIRPAYYEEYRAEKIFCTCGCLVRRSSMNPHLKTLMHEETLKKQTDETKLSIEKLNEKIKMELKIKYDEKKEQEKLKKEKEEEEERNKLMAKLVKQQSPYLIISCPCGNQFQKREQKRHETSKHHTNFLKTQSKTQ